MQNETRKLDTRAPYQAPQLRIYGDLAALTQTIGVNMGSADNGMNKSA